MRGNGLRLASLTVAVPRLELLLEHLGYQVYSSAGDSEEGERSRRSSSAASVQSGDVCTLRVYSRAYQASALVFRPSRTRPGCSTRSTSSSTVRGATCAASKHCTTYVHRWRCFADLQHYAVPLRQFAQDKDTEIIPAHEAEQMFINLNDIVTANKMLLCELEGLNDQGIAGVAAHIGDVLAETVCLHGGAPCADFAQFSNFQSYDEYLGTYEQAKDVYNNMLKRRSFREYIEVCAQRACEPR